MLAQIRHIIFNHQVFEKEISYTALTFSTIKKERANRGYPILNTFEDDPKSILKM